MSDRLDCIYDLIPKDSQGVADIGTDHGIIPIRLIEEGYTGTVVASDIKLGPLNKAIQAAHENGVYSNIHFELTNGLQGIDKYNINTIIIAGMGGETITSILDLDYWCCAPEYKLILQPMTQAHILRFWLINNEFRIQEEILQKDDSRIYAIMVVEHGNSHPYSDAELYTGKYEQQKNNSLFPEFLNQIIRKFEIRVEGQSQSLSNQVLNNKFLNINILNQLYEMKERLSHESK